MTQNDQTASGSLLDSARETCDGFYKWVEDLHLIVPVDSETLNSPNFDLYKHVKEQIGLGQVEFSFTTPTIIQVVVALTIAVALLRASFYLKSTLLGLYYGAVEAMSIELKDSVTPVGTYLQRNERGEIKHCLRTFVDGKQVIVPIPQEIVIGLGLAVGASYSRGLNEMSVRGSTKIEVAALPNFQVKFVSMLNGEPELIGMGFRVDNLLITAMHVFTEVNSKSKFDPKKVFIQGRHSQVPWPDLNIAFKTNNDLIGFDLPITLSSVLGLSKGSLASLTNGAYITIYGANEMYKPAYSHGLCVGVNSYPFGFDHLATTQPGDSGSPILDSKKRIVGVHLGCTNKGTNRGVALDFLMCLNVVNVNESSQDGEQIKLFKTKMDWRKHLQSELEDRGEIEMSDEAQLMVERRQGLGGERVVYNFRKTKAGQQIGSIELNPKFKSTSWADMMDEEDDGLVESGPPVSPPITVPKPVVEAKPLVEADSDEDLEAIKKELADYAKLIENAKANNRQRFNEYFIVPKTNESASPVIVVEEVPDFRGSRVTGSTASQNPVAKPLSSKKEVKFVEESKKLAPVTQSTPSNRKGEKKTKPKPLPRQ